MGNIEIEFWKASIEGTKRVYVQRNVKAIHPVVDKIVRQLSKIDLIQYIRVEPEDIHASNEIAVKGRTKMPISTPGHPTAVGVHLILIPFLNTVQFFGITSAVKGYGERMVKAILKSIPDDWAAVVALDYSGGFWDKMAGKYPGIEFL